MPSFDRVCATPLTENTKAKHSRPSNLDDSHLESTNIDKCLSLYFVGAGTEWYLAQVNMTILNHENPRSPCGITNSILDHAHCEANKNTQGNTKWERNPGNPIMKFVIGDDSQTSDDASLAEDSESESSLPDPNGDSGKKYPLYVRAH